MNSKMDGNAFNDIGKTNNHLLFYKFSMINEILDMSKIEANAMKVVKSNFFISRIFIDTCI